MTLYPCLITINADCDQCRRRKFQAPKHSNHGPIPYINLLMEKQKSRNCNFDTLKLLYLYLNFCFICK